MSMNERNTYPPALFVRRLLVCLVLLPGMLVLVQCNKEESNQPPLITVYSPENGTSVSTQDSLWIHAAITDDQKISSVKVVLNDDNYIPVSTARYLYPSSASYDLTLLYPIENDLLSGTYYLLIRAVENDNDHAVLYRQVLIDALPQDERRFIVITRKSESIMEINGLDEDGNGEILFEVEGDFAGSAINNAGELLYIAGKNQFNLKAFNLAAYELLWEKEPFTWEPLHNNQCLFYDKALFVTFRQDYVQGYYPQGSLIFTTNIDVHDSPEEIFTYGSYLLADMQKRNGGTPEIAIYNRDTGEELLTVSTTFDVTGFHGIEGNRVIICANAGYTGAIYEYNISENHLHKMSDLQASVISSAKVNSKVLLLGTTGGLIQYNLITNSFTELLPGVQADHLLFDQASGIVCFSSGTTAYLYNYPQMENQKTFPFSDSIYNLHLQFYKK